jgi:hypothetical protein
MQFCRKIPFIFFSFLPFAFSALEFASAQCVIQPIKPIPPLGCKDVTPQCISDNNEQGHWTWICVPDNVVADTNKRRARPITLPAPSTPGSPNENTIQTAPGNHGELPPQKLAIKQTPIEIPKEEWVKAEIIQIRSIVQTIKQCRPDIVSIKVGKHGKEKMTETTGIPFNVTWDVTASNSIRAPYSAYIELVVGHRMDTDSMRIGDVEMMNDFNSRPAFVSRYEFDLAPDGLSLQRKLKRNENENRWSDDQERGWCWDRAVLEAEKAK